MRVLAFLVLIAACSQALAFDEADIPPASIPRLAASAAGVEAFAPQGWSVEAKGIGDIDGDGRADAAFVLHQADPKNVLKNDGMGPDRIDTNPRIFAVAAGTADGFRLVAQDSALIPRHTQPNMDDPFTAQDLVVAKGSARLTLRSFASAGSWEAGDVTFTFKIKAGAVELIGYDRNDLHRGSGETTSLSINYPAGKMSRDKGSIEDDKDKKVWSKAPKRGPNLNQIGDGFAFDPLKTR